ncbi:LuxR C-terminal-related transcriptional regulator [Acetobacterium carbinolicum]|uniref:LuxR C-terminal-related transcriptional regulator n=1 Tax=Acetobacterium carbinolicum TaxID=52690 RepID=UPI003BF49C57
MTSQKSMVTTPVLSPAELNFTHDSRILIDVLEAVYDFVAILDEDLIFLDCSASLSELFKAGGNFPIGKCLTDLFPEFAKKDLYSEYKLSSNRIGYYERDNFALDDLSIYKYPSYVRFRMFPKSPFIICTAENITIRIQYDILKQKYLKLLAKNEQLEMLLLSADTDQSKICHPPKKEDKVDLVEILENQKFFTPREIEIAMLIVKGYSTKEIAENLLVSKKTVNFHRLNIRDKLGLKNSQKSVRSCLLDL